MEKSKKYKHALFSADTIKQALKCFASDQTDKKVTGLYKLERGDESWEYDDEEEYFADYRKAHDESRIRKSNGILTIWIMYRKHYNTIVTVTAKTRGEIEAIFELFEQHYLSSIKAPPQDKKKEIVIFIGHGGSTQWRDLKDHLADKHGYKVEAYETGARAGQPPWINRLETGILTQPEGVEKG